MRPPSRWKSKRREYDLPLISPQAIEAYLARPFNDYSFLKAVPREELRAYAAELGFRYVTEPRANQLVCNIIAAQEPRFLFYLDMGAGKSKERLDYIRFAKRHGRLQRALIGVPEFVHIDSWEEQIQEHAPDLRYVKLLGDKDDRFELIDKKADIYLINYAGLAVYMSRLRKSRNKKGEVENKKNVYQDAAAEFASMFNIVHFDEIHRIRSSESLTFRLLGWLGAGAPVCTASTGTPFGRDLLMLWPQFKIVDDGETLGALGMFRAAFFDAKKRYFGGYDYKFKAERAPDLRRLLANKSIVYEEHELAADLPKKTMLRVNVRMSPEQKMYYGRITDRLKEIKGDFKSLESIYIRFRQCASGFLSLKDDDESRVELQMSPNPKLEALKQVAIDLPSSEKFLVFYQFHYSGGRIRALLDEMKIPWATLYGRSRMSGDGIKDPDGQYARFLEDKRCRVFVLQNQAGSEAINPQKVSRYAWFYERPDDPLTSQQAEKRIYRPGQTRPCFIGDLVMAGTVEEKLLRYVQESRDVRKAIFSGEEVIA